MTPISYGRTLYYPYIHFRNEKWLKTASLFYKGIDRIVPKNYSLFLDSPIVKALNESDDFIRNIDPPRYAENIVDTFLAFAKKNLMDKEVRENLFSDLNKLIPADEKFLIHNSKMALSLQKELPKLGLAQRSSRFKFLDRLQKWYEFEPITGAVYMTFLANTIAKDNNIPIVTDNPIFHSLISEAQVMDLEYPEDLAGTLASIVIETAIPADIENVPIKKIIEFRQKYNDERHLFYNEINTLVSDLQNVNSRKNLKEIIESKKQTIDIAVKNLDRSYKGLGITTTTTFIGLSVPLFASSLGPTLAAAGLITVATGKLLIDGINYYKTRKSSPYSYVLLLKRRLKAETLAEQLWKRKLVI